MKRTLSSMGLLTVSFSFAIIINESEMKDHHPTLATFVDNIEKNIKWVKEHPTAVECLKFFNIIASAFVSEAEELKDLKEEEIKFLDRYFTEKEEKEKSIDRILCFTENISYIKKVFSDLPNENTKKVLKDILEKQTRERINPEIYKNMHPEYFDCVTCNLFARHLLEQLKR